MQTIKDALRKQRAILVRMLKENENFCNELKAKILSIDKVLHD